MIRRIFLISLLVAVVATVWYLIWIAFQIERQSDVDEARPADVIVVLGAAEYRGKPSPVLKARLDHALWLYYKGYAPRILTTGGAGGDPVYTEGVVGRDYLVKHGVPSEMILVEEEGATTVYSTAAAAEIMKRMDLHSCIVVSDGYHIFRTKKMLQARGFTVYGSPRPSVPRGTWREKWLLIKQSIAYALWRVGIPV